MVQKQTGMGPNGIFLGDNAYLDVAHMPGLCAASILRVAANVASGETVTINNTVFRVAVAQTNSGQVTANGELNNTQTITPYVTIPSHGLVAGDVILVGSEFMAVKQKINANVVSVYRGVSGSTIAAHADGVAIFTEAVPGAGNLGVALGATLTPTAFTAALVADINDSRRCTEPVMAILTSVNEVRVVSADRDVRHGTLVPIAATTTYATTETLAGAGNAWDAAAMAGGVLPGPQVTVYHTPTAAEVTANAFSLTFPFPIVAVARVKVITISTQAAKAWNGATTVTGNNVIVDNSGATDWAATDQVEVTVQG